MDKVASDDKSHAPNSDENIRACNVWNLKTVCNVICTLPHVTIDSNFFFFLRILSLFSDQRQSLQFEFSFGEKQKKEKKKLRTFFELNGPALAIAWFRENLY